MAILLTARELGHSFASRPLFTGVSFTVVDGDRIGLIGPNGAGKSTLLKVLAGQLTPDSGELAVRTGAGVGYLAQVPRFEPGETVRDAVRSGLIAAGRAARSLDWRDDARVDALIGKLELSSEEAGADRPVADLSGGWQNRVALARALVSDPQLLLLDEPTIHLDVESIEWLERFLGSAPIATVTVTHDRYFLQHVSRRILELDRRNEGGLLDVAGDYATYVERKAEAMAAQERQEQAQRNLLRRETEWLRRGPAARTTKQTARIERAAELKDSVAELTTRNRTRSAAIELEGSGRRTKKLIEAKAVTKRYGERTIFEPLDLSLGPGSCVALLGPNGCGKSTLLRVLTGAEPASSGEVVHAQGLVVQTFEQDRASLDPEATLADSVAAGSDQVDFRGQRLHRHGYLERFLFRSEQMRMRVGSLSGGEQSRLLIARLMLRPADVLVLDEPTNDLDLATLSVLEETLIEFDGAVLLVSHDRYFVDQVATTILAFDPEPGPGAAGVVPFADLTQWEAWRAERAEGAERERAAPADTSTAPSQPAAAAAGRKRLGYIEQREYEGLEARIADAESALRDAVADSERPENASDAGRLVELLAVADQRRAEVDRLYARWAELEAKLG